MFAEEIPQAHIDNLRKAVKIFSVCLEIHAGCWRGIDRLYLLTSEDLTGLGDL